MTDKQFYENTTTFKERMENTDRVYDLIETFDYDYKKLSLAIKYYTPHCDLQVYYIKQILENLRHWTVMDSVDYLHNLSDEELETIKAKPIMRYSKGSKSIVREVLSDALADRQAIFDDIRYKKSLKALPAFRKRVRDFHKQKVIKGNGETPEWVQRVITTQSPHPCHALKHS